MDRIHTYRVSLNSDEQLIADMAYDAVLRNLAVIGGSGACPSGRLQVGAA